MNEDKMKNRTPILGFLNKHKWRIIIPVLVVTSYQVLTGYFSKSVVSQHSLFVISTRNATNEQLLGEIDDFLNQIKSDRFFRGLVAKYDLFAKERKGGVDDAVIAERLQRAMMIEMRGGNIERGVPLLVRMQIRDEEPQKVASVTREIVSRFEEQPNFQVISKYATPPSDGNPWGERVLFGRVLYGAIFSALLIFIWEIPFLFYSQKTNEMVFEPLKADWQNELLDAKLRNQTWKAFQINIRYSYAFLAAMVQKSPIGSLTELVGKIAKQ